MFKKSLSIHNMPDKSPRSLRRLSDADLYEWTAGWKAGTKDRIAGEVEIRRRESWPARMAIGISVVALVISLASLFVSK